MRPNTLSVIGVVAGALAIAFLIFCAEFALDQRHNFDYDEAEHAVWGLRVASAIEHQDLEELWQSIRQQAFYPPLHSLTVASAYLLGGISLATSRLPSFLLFALGLMFVAIALSRSLKDLPCEIRRTAIGLTLLTAVLSPLMLANASLCMIEGLSLAVSALFLLSFQRAPGAWSRTPKRVGVALGGLLFLAALVKYPLLVMLAPGWAISIALAEPEMGRARWLMLASTAFVTALGSEVAWYFLSDPEQIWYYFFGYPSRGVAHAFTAFLYYPTQLFTSYTAHPLQGALLTMFAVLGTRFAPTQHVVRFAAATIVTAYLAFSLQAEKGPRYLLPLLPQVWFLGGLGVALALQRSERLRRPIALGSLIFLVITMTTAVPAIQERIQRAMEGKPEITTITEKAVAALPRAASVLLIGEGDVFTTRWLRWSLAKEQKVPPTTLVIEGLRLTRPSKRAEDAPRDEEAEPPSPSKTERLREELERQIASGRFSHLLLFVASGRAEKYHEVWRINELRERFPSTSMSEGSWRIVLFDLQGR